LCSCKRGSCCLMGNAAADKNSLLSSQLSHLIRDVKCVPVREAVAKEGMQVPMLAAAEKQLIVCTCMGGSNC
jgi:hypothetical protein